MQKIIATIKQNEVGLVVANLQDALLAMIKYGYIGSMPPGEHPSEKDLQILSEKLKEEYAQSTYGESTTQLVFYFQLQNGLGDILRGVVVDDKTTDKLNEFLKKEGLLDVVDTYSVQGVVSNQSGKPLKDYLVKAFDRDLRIEQPLGEQVITDASGFYQIKYSQKEFSAGDAINTSPDLLVKISDQNNQLIAQSPIRFNASRQEVVNLAIDVKEDKPAEWSDLCKVILPLLVGQGYVKHLYTHGHHDTGMTTDLLPSELIAEDIEFIFKDTGLDPDLVQAWATAYVMRKDAIAELSEVSPSHLEAMQKNGWEFFYAFSSQNFAIHLKQLCGLTADVQERFWVNALNTGKVSEIDSGQLKILFDTLHVLSKLKQLDLTQSPENTSAQLLSITSPEMPKALALKVMPLIDSQDDNSLDEILELRNDDNKMHINRLVQGIRLKGLVGYQPNMIQGLISHLGDDTDSVDDLVKIPTSAYLDMAKQQNMGRGAAYAVQNKIELINPVRAIQSRLKNKELTLEGGLKTAFTKFLDDEPENAEKIIQGKSKIGKNAKDHEKTLKTIGTVMNLGGTIGIANLLITNNVNDIGALARKGKDFLDTHFLEIPKEDLDVIKADVIDKANRFVNSGLDWSMDRPIRVPSWWLEKSPQPTPAQRENLPTLPGFFGDLDECICRPCESMLGQPAYLVDLLMLLSKSDSAFNEFSQRRGDILTLELTCENAEKEVQHIDLALRLLEKSLPNISVPINIQDDEPIDAAYQPLAEAQYPWILPFDLKLTSLRTYLVKLKISLSDIWRLVDTATIEQKAAEILGLHSLSTAAGVMSDWHLISEARTPINVWQDYGLSAGNVSIIDPASSEKLVNQPVVDVLKRVSVLLDRTSLTLDEFEQVIATVFVKGSANLIIDGRDKCKTSQMRLNTGSQPTDIVLGRLQQFVRLYQRIGVWSIETLDAVIQLVGGGLIPTTGSNARTPLLEIAEFKDFAERNHLPIDLLVDAIKTPTNQDLLLPYFNLTKEQFGLLNLLPQPTGNVSALTAFKRLCELANQMAEIEMPVELIAKSILDDDALTAAGYTTETSKSVQAITEFKAKLKFALQQATKLDESQSLTDNVLLIMAKIVGDQDAKRVVGTILKAADKKENTSEAIDEAKSAKSAIKTILQQTRMFGQLKINILDTELGKIFDVKATNNDALETRLVELIKSVSGVLREQALIITLANQFAISEQDSIALLTNRLPLLSANNQLACSLLHDEKFIGNGQFTPAETEQLNTWFTQLFRLYQLTQLLGLDAQTMARIDAIRVGSDQFSWSKFLVNKTYTWQAHWAVLYDFIWLSKEKQFGKPLLFKFLGEDLTQAKQTIANRFDLPKTKTEELLIYAGVTAIDKLYQPSLLRKAFNLCLIAKKLGASKEQLVKLASVTDPISVTTAISTAITLLETKNSKEDWPEKLQKYKDGIRKARRDAVVAYHLVLKNSASADRIWKENDLYEYFLIDPMMQPCMKTTKVVEAMMATQLFAQRVLFGLEPNITVSDELKNYWPWMRNYRVWEANRKVFLFPENWLYPDLRDDKSSSFKLLESTLGQGELNEDSAKEAFGKFLDDVAQMGQVEVLGMYEDISLKNDGTVEIVNDLPSYRVLYVIGRTLNPPYQYYWRSCTDFGSRFMEWSPWQHIELDIQGDHVMPFVMNGGLHIAWPLIKFNRQQEPKENVWEIKLAWSKFDGRSWRKSNISRDVATVKDRGFIDERWGFTFRSLSNKDQSEVRINVYSLTNTQNTISYSSSTPVSTLDNTKGVELQNPIYASDETEALNFLMSVVRDNFSGLDANHQQQIKIFNGIKNQWNTGRGTLDGMLKRDIFLGDHAYCFMTPQVAIDQYPKVRGDYLILDALPVPPDYRVEGFINEFFVSARDWQYGIGSGRGPDYQYFNLFFDYIKANSSQLQLTCEAWVLLEIPNSNSNSRGYLKLDGKVGTLEFYVNGSTIPLNINQSQSYSMAWEIGDQKRYSKCEARLKLNKTLPTGTTTITLSVMHDLAPVTLGKRREQHLVFVFDGSAHKAKDIGFDLNSVRQLVEVAAFNLKNDGKASVSSSDEQNFLFSPVSNSQIWLNGFQEISALGESDIDISSVPTLRSVTNSNFWLIPASTSGAIGRKSNVWHFSEAGISRYIDIDFAQAVAKNNLLVYPDSYQEATTISAKWIKHNTLDISNIQHSTFLADSPPEMLGSLNSSDWQNIAKTGKLVFDSKAPYACYNWEIFFHAPLMIADQLSRQQKFEEAEQWLRYIFDPTSTASGADAKRFLKFRVFKELDTNQQVIDDLTALSQTASGYYTTADTERVKNLIERWRERPFRPFVIARGRHIAFLWRTLFSYLDNLLAWADSLYRRDTRESINEALMLYALAMKILGRKPKKLAGKSKKTAINFNQFVDQWDDFANFWIDVGAPHNQYVSLDKREIISTKPQPTSAGMLAFCMPFNDKILNYWDTVESRIFNIRHCRSIEGIERTLPLSDPPIDPELLIRATAAGLDIGSVIAGLYAPPPHYRYGTLANRATELANDVKALGGALLSALEKRDAEGLALVRGANEISLLKLVTDLRNLQISEAEKNLEALRASRRSVATRYYQYQRLMGKKEVKVPMEGDTSGEESMLGALDEGLASNRSGLGLIHEENEVYSGIKSANDWSTAANISKIAGSGFNISASIVIPIPGARAAGAHEVLNSIALACSAVGDAFSMTSQGWRGYADQQSMLAGHLRRRDEWAFQSNQTLKELQQIDKQILANQVRVEITRKELSNHIEQLEQAQAIDEVMSSKFTNQQLYEWMFRELSSLYDKTYRLALDTARKAERAAERELGTKALNVIRHDYWDSMKQGLLAGERLYHDLKRLEVTYLEQNRREFELTKHISLKRLNPSELMKLRYQSKDDDGNKVNQCEFDIKEWLFDLDTPGHYLRRIKSVSVSIPCVLGPYTSLNCKLTLLKSSIRHDKNHLPQYKKAEDLDEDSRFTNYFGASESIVTSTANADSGMFETQLRDERFLPFEGSGAISTWRLELPANYPQFDYSTISDVILSIRYTARDGGLELSKAAVTDINSQLSITKSLKFPLMLTCKTDFPSEWIKAKANPNESLLIPITKNLLPYWMEADGLKVIKISQLKLGVDSKFSDPIDFKMTVKDGFDYADLGKLGSNQIDMFVVFYLGK